MRRSVFAMAAALAVTLGMFAGSSAEAAPVTAGGALGTVTADLNRVEPVQYVGGRCWRNAGWHGAGWYNCGPGYAYGGGNWHWNNRYSWHNNHHSSWHNRSSWHKNKVRGAHAKAHRGGGGHAHRGGHHGGGHHGGHHGGGHHGGHHR